MMTILRWSRSFSTPMLRNAFLWKNFTRQPALRIRSTTSLPASLEPSASSSTRTCTPAWARSISASATRRPSCPSFHRKVSKCTELAGRTDARDEHVEEGAVLVHLDLVACHGRAERQARQAGHELVDRVVAFDVQRGVAVTADRPDHQNLDDHQHQQHAAPKRPAHCKTSEAAPRRFSRCRAKSGTTMVNSLGFTNFPPRCDGLRRVWLDQPGSVVTRGAVAAVDQYSRFESLPDDRR